MKDALRGAPRIVSAPGHSFSDVPAKCLHIVNLAIGARARAGCRPRRSIPLRFRANLYLDGLPRLGGVELARPGRWRSAAAARRCSSARRAARRPTSIPATGARDMAIPAVLQRTGATGISASMPGRHAGHRRRRRRHQPDQQSLFPLFPVELVTGRRALGRMGRRRGRGLPARTAYGTAQELGRCSCWPSGNRSAGAARPAPRLPVDRAARHGRALAIDRRRNSGSIGWRQRCLAGARQTAAMRSGWARSLSRGPGLAARHMALGLAPLLADLTGRSGPGPERAPGPDRGHNARADRRGCRRSGGRRHAGRG